MFADYTYPIICTKEYVKTVNFYEDVFGYRPVYEAGGYVFLRKDDVVPSHLAVIDVNHPSIPDAYRRPVQGMILVHMVEDLQAMRDYLYMEGVPFVKDGDCQEGYGSYFVVEAPNGVMITIKDIVASRGEPIVPTEADLVHA